jgi:release factor glutamine methyltransferase
MLNPKPYSVLNRLHSKLATEEQVLGTYGAQNRSVLNVREDLSTGATTQLPSEVEFRGKSIRTFGRRIGKSLSNIQKELIENELTKYAFTPEKLAQNKYEKTILEIGFGMGEHFVHQMSLNPTSLFIGAEVYLNGVANSLKLAGEQNINNFLIWPGDIDLILANLPGASLDGIYILFPDPWHKRRYMKKRLFNSERLQTLKTKLKQNGFLVFASDIDDYFESAKTLIQQDHDLSIQNSDFLAPHEGYVKTKYHQKAEAAGRIPQFLYASKA